MAMYRQAATEEGQKVHVAITPMTSASLQYCYNPELAAITYNSQISDTRMTQKLYSEKVSNKTQNS